MAMMRSDVYAALVAAVGLLAGAIGATAGDMLSDRHAVRGVGCAECHGKSAPQNAVTSAACVGCHGTLTAMAAQPMSAGRKPHAVGAGAGAPDCFVCHHGHTP